MLRFQVLIPVITALMETNMIEHQLRCQWNVDGGLIKGINQGYQLILDHQQIPLVMKIGFLLLKK